MKREQLLVRITEFYLDSRDFNGIPITLLLDAEAADRLNILCGLVGEELVTVVFGDRHPNPHIRGLPDHHPPTVQIEMLRGGKTGCVYPLPKHLRTVVDSSAYHGRPYTLELALGEPQIVHRGFDLSVLEIYRNDPRYYYDANDIGGSISVSDEHFATGTLRESDRVLLQTFGFCHDENGDLYVGVYLRYLKGLSPEHQQIWKLREVTGATQLHPDYHRASMGHWPEQMSLFDAFIEELKVINQMAAAMERPPLFRNDFSSSDRLKDFAFLLRPTARELNGFVHLLDKMLSENINRDFFKGQVAFEEDHLRGDGRIEVRNKGTLKLLAEWLGKRFKTAEQKPVDDMLAALREIRQLRQRPAHALNDDRFDKAFGQEQRRLVRRAYGAVRTLRLVLSNHPKAKLVAVDSFLYEGKIWNI